MSSAKSDKQQAKTSQGIPVRTVVVNDPNQLPPEYGTTPGGTIFSTTPGGTRIVYERKFLLQCRNSPHSLSPPCNLPTIPGVTEPDEDAVGEKLSSLQEESSSAGQGKPTPKENIAPRKSQERDDMFEMDI